MKRLLCLTVAAAASVPLAAAQQRDPEPQRPATQTGQAETRQQTQAGDAVERPTIQPPARDNRLPPSGGSLFQQQMAQQTPRPDGDEMAAASFLTIDALEPRIFEKHDLITVIIRESSKVESEAEAESEKSAFLRANLAQFFRPTIDPIGLENLIDGEAPRIDLSASGGWEGEGEYEREDSFVARITGRVIDVKPNGNLVVEATKRITTDEEEQVFLLTGTVRAEDVTADNTVLSTDMADLDLKKFTGGMIRKAVEKGWLPKIYDRINPF